MRPEPQAYRLALAIAAALLMAVTGVAAAAQRKQPTRQADEVFRCRDANGRYIYGQAIPAPCMEQDIEVIDGTGRVVRIIPGRRSLEQVAAQKQAEEAAKAAAQRDRTLLATYLSVADIERLRDQRVELLEQQSRITEQYIANLRERESRLMSDSRRFRPYNDSDKAPPVPDHLAEEMVNTVNGLQVYEQELTKNNTERDKLRAEFDADIARFKELKGVN
jgi:hypothetical protein